MPGRLPRANSIPSCNCPENEIIVAELNKIRISTIERTLGQSNFAFMLGKAIKSISQYPMPIRSGKESLSLSFVGKSIADLIQKILCENGIASETPPEDISPNSSQNQSDARIDSKSPSDQEPKRRRKESSNSDVTDEQSRKKEKVYVPRIRSGGYAILVALGKAEMDSNYLDGSMTRSQLIQVAQPFCDSSFANAGDGNYYNAWSSMALLLKKELVFKDSSTRPPRFSLTESGSRLAVSLLEKLPSAPAVHESESNLDEFKSRDQNVVGAPCEVEVVLLLDNRERGYKDRDYLRRKIEEKGISCEVLSLALGDVLWAVCDKKKRLNRQPQDLHLVNYIIERKKISDLIESIKDGRYLEQKYRLKKCPIQNVLYLVEGNMSRTVHEMITDGSVPSAIAATESTDSFLVHQTRDIDHTIDVLSQLTNIFQEKVSSEDFNPQTSELTKHLPTLSQFSDEWGKNMELSPEVTFGKQLQMILGISMEKSMAIIEIYKSMFDLNSAYDKCNSVEEENVLLSDINFLSQGLVPKKIGRASSIKIRNFLRDPEFVSPISRPRFESSQEPR